MAVKLAPAERAQLEKRAWNLSIKGKSAPEIGEALGVSERTVDTMLGRVRHRLLKRYDSEAHTALIHFEAEQSAVIDDSWARLDELDGKGARSLSGRDASDYHSNILTASKNKAQARGLLSAKREDSETLTAAVAELMAALNRPITVNVHMAAEDV